MTLDIKTELNRLADAGQSPHIRAVARRAEGEIEYLRIMLEFQSVQADRWRKLAIEATSLADEIEADTRAKPAPQKPKGGKA